MTMPDERTRAVLLTKRFLIDLTNPTKSPKIPKSVREHARMLLRHFPTEHDLAISNLMCSDMLLKFMLEPPFEHPDKVIK